MKLVDLDMLPKGDVCAEDFFNLPEIKIMFICDGRNCNHNCEREYCKHTTNPEHAENFKYLHNTFVERG